MSHIFISYSRKDLAFAQKIVDALAANKLDTWIDWNSIQSGEKWRDEIFHGIEEAEAFLFLISPDSVHSEMCNEEIAHAVRNGKRIITLIIRDTSTGTIPKAVSEIQWIKCRDGQDDIEKAIIETRETVHTDYDWLKYHTRLQVKALEWERTQDASRLLRGKELQEAEEQFAESHKDPQPTDLQRNYLLNSRKNEELQRRRLTIGLTFGLIVVAILAIFAWGQRNAAIASEETAVSEANARATAQKAAEQQGATAIAESIVRATAQAEAVGQREEAERRLEELESIRIAQVASNVYSGYQPELALSLAIKANSIINPPFEAQRILSNILSSPGTAIRFDPNAGGVEAVAMHPLRDRAISSHFDGSIVLWDLINQKELWRINGHTNSMTAVSFSPDGTKIISGSEEGKIWIWDSETGNEIMELPGHKNVVTTALFNETGDKILSASYDGTFIVWDFNTKEKVFEYNHGYEISDAAFVGDDRVVFSSNWTEKPESFKVKIIDIKSGNTDLILDFDKQIWCVAVSPNGEQIAIGKGTIALGSEIILFDVSNGKVEKVLQGHTLYLRSLDYSPSGKLLASGSADSSVRVWDVDSGLEVVRIDDHIGYVTAVAYGHTDNMLISGADDGIVRVLDITPFPLINQFDLSRSWVNSVRFSKDGNTALIATGDGLVLVFDITSGNEINSIDFGGHVVNDAIFNHDETKVLASVRDGTIRIWDYLDKHDTRYRLLDGDTGEVYFIAMHPKENKLIAAYEAGDILLWDLDNFEVLRKYKGHTGVVTDVSFSPDGEHFISGSSDSSICLWDYDSGDQIRRYYGHTSGVMRVAINQADPNIFISTSYDNTIRIWRIDSPDAIKALGGHTRTSLGLNISPDGKSFISGEQDGSMKLWDLQSGEELYEFEGHKDAVQSVSYSPNGAYALTGSRDGTIRYWKVPRQDLADLRFRSYRYLTCFERQIYQILPYCGDKDKLFLEDMTEEKRPMFATYYLLEGISQYNERHYQEALHLLETALEINPNFTRVKKYIGDIYYDQGNYEKAIEVYTSLVDLNPHSAAIWNSIGEAAIELRNYQLAISSYSKAIEAHPDYPPYVYDLGWAHYVNGSYGVAEGIFNQVLEVDADYYPAINARGRARYFLEKYEDAISDFELSLDIQPTFKDAETYEWIGWSYFQMDEYEFAIKNFTESLSLDPKNESAHDGRGRVYYYLDNYEAAVADFTKVYEIQPSYINLDIVFNYLSWSFYNLNDLENSIVFFSKQIEFSPEDGDGYDDRGFIYYQLSNYELAVRDIEKALEIDIDQYGYNWNLRRLGTSYYLLGQHEKAQRYFDEIIRSYGSSAEGYVWVGLSYYDLQEYKVAIDYFNIAISKDPQNPSSLLGLGDSYYKIGQLAEALGAYKDYMSVAKKPNKEIIDRIHDLEDAVN